MPSLFLLSGPSVGLRHELLGEATMGRSPSCELPVPEDDRLSRRHARFFVRQGLVHVEDLGSRNGTSVNGERITGEVALHPGDRVQVGRTLVLLSPPGPSVAMGQGSTSPEATRQSPLGEVLPHVGSEAALYSAGVALLGATSEAMVLRHLAEQALHALHAETAAALLGSIKGLLTSAVVGASSVVVPRDMARAAMEHAEQSRTDGRVCSPLVASGAPPFGVLYLERAEPPFSEADARLAAMLGRLGGEAYAAARARLGAQSGAASAGTSGRVELVGGSRPFRKVVEQARRASASDAPVVLFGPPGSGKSLVARYIHARSPRALGPLVTVDCRAAAFLEAELFGGASAPGAPPTPSALSRADAGSLLLVHVERLPRFLAERLARLLARGQAPAREGGEEPVNVRLLVTAPVPPRVLALQGMLDEALALQFSGLEVALPALSERAADILPLFEHFTTRPGRPGPEAPPVLAPEAQRLLTAYAWPHNVRELELLGARLALLYGGTSIPSAALPPEFHEDTTQASARTLQERVARLEREAIAEALRAAGGRKIAAARLLGISRPTLDKKIEDYGLTVERRRA